MNNREEKRITIARDLMSRFDIKYCNKYPKRRFYVYNEKTQEYEENKHLLEKEIWKIWPESKITDRSAILSFISIRVEVEDIKNLDNGEE